MNGIDDILTLLKPTGTGISHIEPAMVLIITFTSFLFGLALKAVYFSYYKSNEPIDSSIPRSFPIIAPAITVVFWIIQYSLPLSLGLLGALSFVRFRTPVKRAEDIAFILLVIACSLAIAVQQFFVSFILVLFTYVFSLIRHKLPQLGDTTNQQALITVNTTSLIDPEIIKSELSKMIPKLVMVSFSTHDGITSAVFNSSKLDEGLINKINENLGVLDQNIRIDIFYPDQNLGGH